MILDLQRYKKARGFTLIELMIVVAILGILAVIAIPALTKQLRRSKTSEARVQLAKLFDSTAAYFNEEHVDAGRVALIGAGGALQASAPHRCPHQQATPAQGQADLTPVLALNCNDGPGGRCVPAVGGAGGGFYDINLWGNNDVWNALNFQMEQAHYFHYNYRYSNVVTGYGSCQFTAQAFGNLDNDANYSTYERSGAADQNGVNGAQGLFIADDVE